MGPCQSDIKPLIQKLPSDTSEASQAAIKLLDLAKESPECRDVVINGVIGALNTADVENDDSAFRLWAKGSGILGQLKAVEAVDLLIAHLDLSDGLFSASMVHEPVVPAIVKMGQVAVPKLSLALKTNPKKKIRLAAAYCLGDIGGSEALDAMKSALGSETEECVRRFITLTLPNTDETANSNRPLTRQDGELLRQRILAYTCSN
jgi:HEAT repeat protein